MTKAQVTRFLRSSVRIDVAAWHYDIVETPCSVKGQVSINGKVADFFILSTYAGRIWFVGEADRHSLKLNCAGRCEKITFGKINSKRKWGQTLTPLIYS